MHVYVIIKYDTEGGETEVAGLASTEAIANQEIKRLLKEDVVEECDWNEYSIQSFDVL